MPYHDNEYTPDSPKKTTESKEELIAPPGFHYMPDGTLMSDAEHEKLYGQPKETKVEEVETEIVVDKTISKQNQLIKKIEAEAKEEKLIPTVLSPKRSAFLNKARKGGGGSGGGCGIVTINNSLQMLYFPDILSLSSPGQIIYDLSPSNLQNDTGLLSATFIGDGVARYGDKIWIGIKYLGGSSFTGASVWYHAILELDFNESIPSASFSRVINTGAFSSHELRSRSGINNNTVLFSGGLNNNLSIKFDISGTVAS